MSIQDWGAIGELVGGIAVIVTLIYLAVQIRQNTRVVKTTNYLNLASDVNEFARLLAENTELSELYLIGREDFQSLSASDQIRFNMVMTVLIQPYQSMFQMKGRGHMDEELMLNSFEILSTLLKQPGVRQWWEENRIWWEASFQDFMGSVSNATSAREYR